MFTAVLVVPGYLLLDNGATVPGILMIAVGGYMAAFIGIYFNVGLAAAADRAMRGEPTSLGEGMRIAQTRTGPIAGWALLAVTVNLILSAIQSESGILGRILSGLFAVAWNLITFLVVPVIALEGLGPIDALKRSGSLFKKRWGQQITGNIAIGGLVALMAVLPAVALGVVGAMLITGGGAGVAGGVALMVVALALLVTGIVISSALRGIFGVALYHFADSGEGVGVFSTNDLESAVRTKKGRLG